MSFECAGGCTCHVLRGRRLWNFSMALWQVWWRLYGYYRHGDHHRPYRDGETTDLRYHPGFKASFRWHVWKLRHLGRT